MSNAAGRNLNDRKRTLKMAKRKNSVHGTVVAKWQAAGEPDWAVHQTLRICVEVDRKLEAEGFEPAPKFRKAVKKSDEKYLMTWTFGCHFEWLNPRPK